MDAVNTVAVRPWYEVVQQTLKRNDVKLVTYVPDKVFTPLIKGLHADTDFLTFATARAQRAALRKASAAVDLDLVMPGGRRFGFSPA